MNNSFENMQKLAFGKILIKESIESKKFTKESLKAHIREMILAEINADGETYVVSWYGTDKRYPKSGEDFQQVIVKALNKEDAINKTSDIIGIIKGEIEAEKHSNVNEAKKKKKEPEDVAPQEDIDINLGTEEPTAEPTAEPTTDTMTPEVGNAADINPTVKSIQDSLQKAFASAKELGDAKLVTQIGNTITMLVRDQVLGGGQQ